jgi:transposase
MAGYEPLSPAELLDLLAERDAEIAELRAQLAALEQQLARLERLVSRNSSNSSFPPSVDDQPGRRGITWPGARTRTRPSRISRPGPAIAARHWPTARIWG